LLSKYSDIVDLQQEFASLPRGVSPQYSPTNILQLFDKTKAHISSLLSQITIGPFVNYNKKALHIVQQIKEIETSFFNLKGSPLQKRVYQTQMLRMLEKYSDISELQNDFKSLPPSPLSSEFPPSHIHKLYNETKNSLQSKLSELDSPLSSTKIEDQFKEVTSLIVNKPVIAAIQQTMNETIMFNEDVDSKKIEKVKKILEVNITNAPLVQKQEDAPKTKEEVAFEEKLTIDRLVPNPFVTADDVSPMHPILLSDFRKTKQIVEDPKIPISCKNPNSVFRLFGAIAN
jgi:hypothetical protein